MARIMAYRSAKYGPPNVTDKYRPLDEINFKETDPDFCKTLLTRRWQVLKYIGLLPQTLGLLLPNWETAIAAEAGKNPPLVVISTNRSNWIKKGIDAGNRQLEALDVTQFDNASDLRALLGTARQTVSPPMYHPSRIGSAGPRNVYVVVHAAEYLTYKRTLAGTGITVVGWIFQPPRENEMPLVGFGASRFAAIQFCKELRTAAGEPWNYAWLFDDNVVAFTSFAGYTKVEAAMAKGKRDPRKPKPIPYICAGFSGGTKTISVTKNAKWAYDELEAGKEDEIRGKQYAELPPTKPDGGVIQQAALWNIAELTAKHLNFGPIFLTSGEDVSFGNYFMRNDEIPFLYYEGIGIVKEDNENDGSEGAQLVLQGRDALAEVFAASERIDARPYLEFPPPIMIKPLKRDGDTLVFDDSEQPLGDFIVKTVVPNASADIRAKATEKKTNNTAMCQAAEQTICEAIGLKLVKDEAALEQTFKINGTTPQRVKRINK